jgi:hypothetical protein
MGAVTIRKWDPGEGPLSEEVVRSSCVPGGHYRVSSYHYPVGSSFSGAMRAGTMWVIEGRCRVSWAGQVYELGSLDIAEFPEGKYQFEVLGRESCRIVCAWLLPSDEDQDL